MSQEWECMCMTCGISVYLDLEGVAFDDTAAGDMQVLKNVFCPECGGHLGLVGRAGDRPFYEVL
jgi:hypothetical protein